jgi:hypothetical protein
MAYSDIDVSECPISVYINAFGGTRRQRGAAIAAYLRSRSDIGEKLFISYSEAYGFNTATYARYRKVDPTG